jgi:hypothetical protein
MMFGFSHFLKWDILRFGSNCETQCPVGLPPPTHSNLQVTCWIHRFQTKWSPWSLFIWCVEICWRTRPTIAVGHPVYIFYYPIKVSGLLCKVVRPRKDLYQMILYPILISQSSQKGYFLSLFGAGYFLGI